jgi:hypothetical protein
MVATNRRIFPRHDVQASVQVLMAAEGSQQDPENVRMVSGKIYNQSRDGLYIETDRILEPGANVSIKMVSPQENHPENAYFIRDGQVIWCQKVEDGAACFGVGVKILRKVVQADVLTSRFR